MSAGRGYPFFRKLREFRLYFFVVAIAYASAFALEIFAAPLRVSLQNLVFDQYQRWRPRDYSPDQPVRIIDIDDESIRRLGRWPWPHQRMAAIVDALVKANVAAIGFDILFSEADSSEAGGQTCDLKAAGTANPDESCPSEPGGDFVFARAIAGRPVVLGSFLTIRRNGAASIIPAKSGLAVAGDSPLPFLNRLSEALAPQSVLMANAAGIGFMNWLPDSDRVVRRVPLLLAVNDQILPSLALESLRVAQQASTYLVRSSNASGESGFEKSLGVTAVRIGAVTIPTQPAADVRMYFANSDERRSMPAWRVLSAGADLSDLAGKIVIVGATASLLADVIATPLNPSTPGVEVHAQLLEQVLSGAVLLRPDWATGAEFIFGSALSLLLIIAIPFLPVFASALLGAAAALSLGLASWLAFVRHGVLLDPVSPSFSSGFVFLAGVVALYSHKRRQVGEIRSAFGRFVSPAVVARLAEHPENLQLGGLQRRLTLMFCDLRSFTTLSEGLSAIELTKFLNEYLTPMTDVILGEIGTVDKYMGDAIMAFWNAPLDDPNHAANAVRAALKMRACLARLNARWDAEPNVVIRGLKFGVGLNTGECCVGNLGSTRRFDYSAIGDEVNVASRLEGACKFFGVDIVASASTRKEAPNFAWLEIDQVLLKNKTLPLSVFALVGAGEYALSSSFRELFVKHEAMLSAYRDRKFETALARADEAAGLAVPEIKGLYEFYCRRFRELAAMELPSAWLPMIVLAEK